MGREDKLHRERKALNDYRETITDKSEVDIIPTKEDGDCLGFTYMDDNKDTVRIYYHEPSLCFCIEDSDGIREINIK